MSDDHNSEPLLARPLPESPLLEAKAEDDSQLPRIITAAPVGFLVVVLGIAMAVWSGVHFNTLARHSETEDMRQLFMALRIALPAVWIVVIFWGINVIFNGLDRATLADRLDGQDSVLHRIEESINSRDGHKQQLDQKSRSFWARIRNDPN